MEQQEGGEPRHHLVDQVLTLFFPPIAGGVPWKIVYNVLACALTAYFIVSLANAAPHWSEKVTELRMELRQELPFPDVYVCIPADVVRSISVAEVGSLSPIKYVGGKDCKTGPALVGMSITAEPDDPKFKACPGQSSTSEIQSYQLAIEDLPVDEVADNLANLLPKKGPAEKRVRAGCVVHRVSDPTQNPTQAEKVGLLTRFEIAFQDPIHFEVYFTQPGVPPYEGKDTSVVINGSSAFLPGQGFASIVDMALTEIVDSTQGHGKATWHVQPSVVPSLSTDRMVGVVDATHVFRWGRQLVTVINIRYKTFAEVMSEIGGLWAIVPAVLAFLFMPTGKTDPSSQREVFLFSFLPRSLRRAYLQRWPQVAGDERETGAVGTDPVLAKKVDDLVARVDAMDGGRASVHGSLSERVEELRSRVDALAGAGFQT